MKEITFPTRLFLMVVTLLLVLLFTSTIGVSISKSVASMVKNVDSQTLEQMNGFMRVSLSTGARG